MNAIVYAYVGGVFLSPFVFRARAGLGVWRGLRILGPGGVGIGWMTLQSSKALVWPILLAWWLANNRPEPSTLFNEKAEEARRRRAEEHRPG